MSSSDGPYWLALLCASSSKRPVAKRVIFRWCVEGSQPLASLFDHDPPELADQLGLTSEEAAQLLLAGKQVPAQVSLLDDLARQGVGLLLRTEVAYPEALIERLPEERTPYFLFYRGNPAITTEPGFAILGGEDPSPEAERVTKELSLALAGDRHHFVGGYGRGMDRLALVTARDAGAEITLILPLGIRAFAKHLDAWKEPLEAGRLLVLSPFAPDEPYREALAEARLSLVAALSEAVFLIAPDRSPGEWLAIDELLEAGRRVFAWGASEDAFARAWIEAGAIPFGDVASAHQLLLEWLGAAPRALEAEAGDVGGLLSEAPIAFADADSAIEALSRAGTVPEVLARKLRDAKWPSE